MGRDEREGRQQASPQVRSNVQWMMMHFVGGAARHGILDSCLFLILCPISNKLYRIC